MRLWSVAAERCTAVPLRPETTRNTKRARAFGRWICRYCAGIGAPVRRGSLAVARGCPDVEVVFARGTGEPPGVGPTGQAFVDAVRSRVRAGSFDVYPVNYPASDQWDTGLEGIKDAGAHVVSTANGCPRTKMVLGGYSQGAAVMGFVTSDAVPEGR